MHTVHAGFSLVAVLTPGREDAVKEILKAWNKDAGNHSMLPFAKAPSVLCASGIVIPSQNYCDQKVPATTLPATTLPATLLLFTSYCGPFKNHIDELIRIGDQGFRQLFQNCQDFPDDALTCNNSLKKFLIKHRHHDTFYTGIQFNTCTDIGREEQLRKAISEYLYQCQQNNAFQNFGPIEIRKQIQEHIKSKGDEFLWAQKSVRKTFMDYWVLYAPPIIFRLILLSLIISLITDIGIFKHLRYPAIALLLAILFIMITFRMNERDKTQRLAATPSRDILREISASQNQPVINEMTAAGPLKKGWIRRVVLRIVLKLVSIISGTINIPTIATARWLAIDKGKRLVFISNFANRSESYVRDFIDSPASQKKINLLFGHCDGYPRTNWLTGKGAINNLQGFMNVVQEDQHLAQFWYYPYKNLSVDNINNNHKIRFGLFAKLWPGQVKKWLRLL